MAKTQIIASATAKNSGEIYRTDLIGRDQMLVADEPEEFGGTESGPSPADYLCMALASCKAITIRMYTERKGWKIDEITVRVNFVKSDQMASGPNSFFCEIKLTGALNDAQRQRILDIAKVCPVERLLSRPGSVVTVLE